MTERWLPIPGWEDRYSISSWGRVLSRARRNERILRHIASSDGYASVRLYRGEPRGVRIKIHQLVCRLFNGPPTLLHKEVGHLDGDRMNPRAENLKWVSRAENCFHKRFHGTHQAGAQHPRAKLTSDAVALIHASPLGHSALARKFGVKEAAIRKIRKGHRWTGSRPQAVAPVPASIAIAKEADNG